MISEVYCMLLCELKNASYDESDIDWGDDDF